MAASKNGSLSLQPRDLAILLGLFESRIMTRTHVSSLHFIGKQPYATKRLQKLKAAGYIGERKRNANEPSILCLTRKGFAHLKNEGHLSEYPQFGINSFESRARVSQFTLRHELEIMDVKAAFHSAIQSTEKFNIAEFSTWPLLNQFEVSRNGYGSDILVKPDGFIRFHEKESAGGVSEHSLFLEVDRSSEMQDTLVNRAGAYFDYYKSGGFAVKNGATRDCFKEYPFRVLFVFKSAERRNNMAERLLQNTPPILTLVYLTTFAEVKADPLGPIWIRPLDYREVTKGTHHDPEGRSQQFGYKRQTARELFIELKIRKIRLLENSTF